MASKPPFLIQKFHQFIFVAVFEFPISHIFHRKKLDDFNAENLTKITTNVKKKRIKTASLSNNVLKDENIDHAKKKKLKIALLNKTVF